MLIVIFRWDGYRSAKIFGLRTGFFICSFARSSQSIGLQLSSYGLLSAKYECADALLPAIDLKRFFFIYE